MCMENAREKINNMCVKVCWGYFFLVGYLFVFLHSQFTVLFLLFFSSVFVIASLPTFNRFSFISKTYIAQRSAKCNGWGSQEPRVESMTIKILHTQYTVVYREWILHKKSFPLKFRWWVLFSFSIWMHIHMHAGYFCNLVLRARSSYGWKQSLNYYFVVFFLLSTQMIICCRF